MGRAWVLVPLLLPLVACKNKGPGTSPARDVESWTLAEIESELANNDRALAGEGIVVVAVASPVGPAPSIPMVEPQPITHPDGPGQEPPNGPGEELPDDGPHVVAGAAAPEPPMPATEPTAAYEAESLERSDLKERRVQRRVSSRSRRDESTRCERICQLADATCELEEQICALAEQHPDEPRYEQACLRAEQQCIAASRACDRCEE